MRNKLLILFFVLALPLLADAGVRDSIQVKEVEITASRLNHFAVTEKVEELDSLALKRYATQDLGALLQRVSLVNVSSNGGAGALTTASIRGASSNQTLVTWNGLPINSMTTGAADLSTINVAGFNNMQLTYGAAGSLYGSGTMGGSIELSNKPVWNQGTSANVGGELGSFSSCKGNFVFRASGTTLCYQGQVLYHDSKNDFTYTDIYDHGQPTETLSHNENKVAGTIHNLYWKVGVNLFDFGAWYQVKEKNIPGLMGVGPPVSHQTQKDSTLKVYAGWKRLLGNCRIEAKAAYLSDFLRYTDKEYEDSPNYKIYSEIGSQRWLADVSTRWYLQTNLSFDVNGRYSRLKGITSNYAENIIEHEGRLNAALKYSPSFGVFIATVGKDWNSTESNEITISETVDGEVVQTVTVMNDLPNPPLMYSLSGKVSVWPAYLNLRAKVATHYRRPTFNDRYWVPGGNLQLNSEEGYNFEVGVDLLEQTCGIGIFDADLAFYYADNNESIAWKPSHGGIWQPINTGAIISKGFDLSLNHQLKLGVAQLHNRLIYGYNKSYDNSPESEDYKEVLGYRPEHILKVSTDVAMKRWNTGLLAYSRSESFTWEGRSVDGYFLMDFNVGYNMAIASTDVKLMARVENIFDTSYQLIRAYPMPGRAYYLSVNINL